MNEPELSALTAQEIADAYGLPVEYVDPDLSVFPAIQQAQDEAHEQLRAEQARRRLWADTERRKGSKHASTRKRAVQRLLRHDRADLFDMASYAGLITVLAAYARGSDPLYLIGSFLLGACALYRRSWAWLILNIVWGTLALERIIR